MHHRRTIGLSLVSLVLVVAGTTAAAQAACEFLPPGFNDCVRDADCKYHHGTCCTCGNGGTEFAYNKTALSDIKSWEAECCDNVGCLFEFTCQYLEERAARCVAGTCTLGRCGDNLVDVHGEDCDDGGESPACDDDCTLPACGDFNVNASAGESCDDGNTTGGDGCSATCQCDDPNDADGDGVGDGCDVCSNAADDTEAKAQFSAVGTDAVAGDDRVKIKGAFTLAGGTTFGDLEPLADGVTVVVRSFDGRPLLTLALPAGAFDGTRGWRTTKPGNKWRYADKAAAPSANGVSKAELKDLSSKDPGRVGFKLLGADGDYPIGTGDVPLRVAVVAGSPMSACGERDYARADCKVSGSGTGVRCR